MIVGWLRCTEEKLYKKELKRKENLRKEGRGCRFLVWSSAHSVRGTYDPKPETIPTVVTSRDLHGTDLIHTDWSPSKPSHVTSEPLLSIILQFSIGSFILMLCGVNLSFYIYINAYLIQKNMCAWLQVIPWDYNFFSFLWPVNIEVVIKL